MRHLKKHHQIYNAYEIKSITEDRYQQRVWPFTQKIPRIVDIIHRFTCILCSNCIFDDGDSAMKGKRPKSNQENDQINWRTFSFVIN